VAVALTDATFVVVVVVVVRYYRASSYEVAVVAVDTLIACLAVAVVLVVVADPSFVVVAEDAFDLKDLVMVDVVVVAKRPCGFVVWEALRVVAVVVVVVVVELVMAKVFVVASEAIV